MAITFPIPASEMVPLLRAVQATFDIGDAKVVTATRGGEQLSAELGVRLWYGSLDLAHANCNMGDETRALLALLRRADSSFMFTPPHRAGPIEDPYGEILGGNVPKLNFVAANNKEIRISGLPEGYKISRGDYLSFAYGTSPVRYAFHQVQNSAEANISGVTSPLEVTPHIRAGFSIDADIKLVNPEFKAIVTKANGGVFTGRLVSGMTMEFIQTLR